MGAGSRGCGRRPADVGEVPASRLRAAGRMGRGSEYGRGARGCLAGVGVSGAGPGEWGYMRWRDVE